jgi:hypothetical protein
MLRVRSHWFLALSVLMSTGGAAADTAKPLPIAAEDIGGVVNGAHGAEAGVWVIAETHDLQVAFRKIVVTDDKGQFLVPDLPKANYKVWVRGYGLVDSAPVTAVRGAKLALTAVAAPDARAAAQVYPPNYWLSLLQFPPRSAFPKSNPQAVATNLNPEASIVFQAQSQTELLYQSRVCFACHQVGDKATRELNPDMPKFDSTLAAWKHRVRIGQFGPYMQHSFVELFPPQFGYSMFADWTDRIAAGEVPPAPPRPQGIERNVVLTEWDWGSGPEAWMHDTITTDKRNPKVNANGPIYGATVGTGVLTVLDPNTNTVSYLKIPKRAYSEEEMRKGSIVATTDWEESPSWGHKPTWIASNHPHNVMFDQDGLLWVTTRIRPDAANPAFCKEGSSNPYAKNFPLTESGRQVAVYDRATGKWTLIDTCFSTHHLQFAEDKNNTLYFSGDVNVVGWLDTSVFKKTGNEEAAQGWCPAYIDVDGDGKFDRKKDRLVETIAYGIQGNPVDDSVWFASPGLPGKIVRMERGANPPATCRTEVYEPPFANPKTAGTVVYGPKGLDFDRQGVVWVTLYSGQLASFDRRKCSVRSGPTATGQQCPEGWTLRQLPGPKLHGAPDGESADFSYYNHVDQFDTFGLGKNVPLALGSNSDSLLALERDTGKWHVFRVPYPLGFFGRGVDGRIDDPKLGWKGRGLWANSASVPVWHQEFRTDAKPYLVRFQLRPDPLAH